MQVPKNRGVFYFGQFGGGKGGGRRVTVWLLRVFGCACYWGALYLVTEHFFSTEEAVPAVIASLSLLVAVVWMMAVRGRRRGDGDADRAQTG